MTETVITLIREMFELTHDIHTLTHDAQEKAIAVAELAEGFPGRLVLDEHRQFLTPVLDPITGDKVPLAVAWKNEIVVKERLYQSTYYDFQQTIDRGFNLVDRLHLHEGVGSSRATNFIGIMDRSNNHINYMHSLHRSLGN